MDALRIHRDVLRAAVSRTMTVLDALLRSQAATALDRQNLLDLILYDQVNSHKLDVQIQANLKDYEFESDILGAIDYDERICAMRTRVRLSPSQDSSASPVPQPRAALSSTYFAASILWSLPEGARPMVSPMVTGDAPPVRAMTAPCVEEHDEKEGAAPYNNAKQDPEVHSQRKGLQQLHDLYVANVTLVTETSQRPCHDSCLANETSTLKTSQRHFGNPRIADLTIAPNTPDLPFGDPSVDDASTVLKASQRSCRDSYVGDADPASQIFQQLCCDSKTVLLDPDTKPRFVRNTVPLQALTKDLRLRRSVSHVRRQRQAAAALVQSRWRGIHAAKQNFRFDGGDLFSGKHESMLDAPFDHVYAPHKSDISWSVKETGMLIECIDQFLEARADLNTMIMPQHSPHAP